MNTFEPIIAEINLLLNEWENKFLQFNNEQIFAPRNKQLTETMKNGYKFKVMKK